MALCCWRQLSALLTEEEDFSAEEEEGNLGGRYDSHHESMSDRESRRRIEVVRLIDIRPEAGERGEEAPLLIV